MDSSTPEGATARLVVVEEFDTTTRIEAPGASGAEL